VSLLAVLKTGAAYVPVDPNYPSSRQQYMLEDSAACLVITDKPLTVATSLPQLNVLRAFAPAEMIEFVGENISDDPRVAASGLSRCYVIYTSGSTGKPKGVMGTHSATLNRFEWMWRVYPFSAGEVSVAKTSICFVDSSTRNGLFLLYWMDG